jgi:hypothetical protein
MPRRELIFLLSVSGGGYNPADDVRRHFAGMIVVLASLNPPWSVLNFAVARFRNRNEIGLIVSEEASDPQRLATWIRIPAGRTLSWKSKHLPSPSSGPVAPRRIEAPTGT